VSGRAGKPTVVAHVTARRLWIGAIVALASSVALSWLVAGLIGGSLHVFALAMAWLYNLRLSRTSWSWLPYALAFGAVPGFVSYGFDGQPPSWWATACFAIIGVSAHLANALPDLELDVAAGRGGSAVRLGRRRSVLVCWTLLAAGTAILAVVAASSHWWISGGLIGGFLAAVAFGTRSPMRSGMFVGIMLAVVVDVVAVVAVT
jgi:4-hydroxybenzoate polyprenyltransferase